jgi:hypothetical protein
MMTKRVTIAILLVVAVSSAAFAASGPSSLVRNGSVSAAAAPAPSIDTALQQSRGRLWEELRKFKPEGNAKEMVCYNQCTYACSELYYDCMREGSNGQAECEALQIECMCENGCCIRNGVNLYCQ